MCPAQAEKDDLEKPPSSSSTRYHSTLKKLSRVGHEFLLVVGVVSSRQRRRSCPAQRSLPTIKAHGPVIQPSVLTLIVPVAPPAESCASCSSTQQVCHQFSVFPPFFGPTLIFFPSLSCLTLLVGRISPGILPPPQIQKSTLGIAVETNGHKFYDVYCTPQKVRFHFIGSGVARRRRQESAHRNVRFHLSAARGTSQTPQIRPKRRNCLLLDYRTFLDTRNNKSEASQSNRPSAPDLWQLGNRNLLAQIPGQRVIATDWIMARKTCSEFERPVEAIWGVKVALPQAHL